MVEIIEPLAGDATEFASLTFPRLARYLAALHDPWFAVGARDSGRPIGLAQGWLGPANEAHLMAVSVARAYRRSGVGARLVEAWRSAAVSRGAEVLVARHSHVLPARVAFEATLRRAGWPPPRLQTLYMAGEAGAMAAEGAKWPAMSGRVLGRADIEFAPWRAPNAADRAAIDRLSAQVLYSPAMAPANYEANLDPAASLAVRRDGCLVGWVLAQPVARPMPGVPDGRHALYYASAYVDEALAATGSLVGGYYHAFSRQGAAYGMGSIACLHTTLPRMQTMVRRRFGPMALRVDETFESRLIVPRA